jgi:hypothetical protein
VLKSKISDDVGEEMNTDENVGGGKEKKENTFFEILKSRMNKNINDLKGIVSDQNEEEC